MKKGLLMVVSGPSGCGKDTLVRELLQTEKNAFISVSATTRNKRNGELDGVDYYFLECDEFNRLVDDGGFLEYACYCENLYGTPKKQVFEMLKSGKDVILVIEVNGALQVKNNYPEAVMVFIMPPSIEELRNRLVGRNTDSPENIAKRMETAHCEISMSGEYDYRVVNDSIDSAVEELREIMKSEKFVRS